MVAWYTGIPSPWPSVVLRVLRGVVFPNGARSREGEQGRNVFQPFARGKPAGMKRGSLLALAAVLAVAACGKKGPPLPPGPADQITYPRLYPAPSKQAPK